MPSLTRPTTAAASRQPLPGIGLISAFADHPLLIAVCNLAVDLFYAFQKLDVSRHLPSIKGGGSLFVDTTEVSTLLFSREFDFKRVRPLTDAVLRRQSDVEIWTKVYRAVIEILPPPFAVPSTFASTPLRHGPSHFPSPAAYRGYVDEVLAGDRRSFMHDLDSV